MADALTGARPPGARSICGHAAGRRRRWSRPRLPMQH